MKASESQENNEELAATIIELAASAQAPLLIKIQQECYLQSYVHEDQGVTTDDIHEKNQRLGAEKNVESIKQKIDDPNEVWLVAKQGDEIVGFVQAKKARKGGAQRVSRLFVRPDKQGSGVGWQLMLQVLSQLDKEKPVYLQVDQYNENTANFYRRFGFLDSGQGKSIKITDGKGIPTRELVLYGEE